MALFARIGADEPAAVLYGAADASATAPSTFGPEAERLRAVAALLTGRLGTRLSPGHPTRRQPERRGDGGLRHVGHRADRSPELVIPIEAASIGYVATPRSPVGNEASAR